MELFIDKENMIVWSKAGVRKEISRLYSIKGTSAIRASENPNVCTHVYLSEISVFLHNKNQEHSLAAASCIFPIFLLIFCYVFSQCQKNT